MKEITVIGSAAMDFVVETDQKPGAGETVIGADFNLHFGGKGANQAISAARLGVPVQMIACVGVDLFADDIIENLRANNVDVSNVERVKDVQTGKAMITVYEADNRIIVIPGANMNLTPDKIEAKLAQLLSNSALVILQNEIPYETNTLIIDYCYDHGIPTLLNPAPAYKYEAHMIDKVTYLTPNEHEFKMLFAGQSFEAVLPHYPNKLIVTMGEQGVYYHNGEEIVLVKSHKTNVVDTTGAGDAFNGAFAVGVTYGLNLARAIDFGNYVASRAIRKRGAQNGLIFKEDLDEPYQNMLSDIIGSRQEKEN